MQYLKYSDIDLVPNYSDLYSRVDADTSDGIEAYVPQHRNEAETKRQGQGQRPKGQEGRVTEPAMDACQNIFKSIDPCVPRSSSAYALPNCQCS